jgi:NTP pyrophosphatase (non-canonical NTP hydrolase)
LSDLEDIRLKMRAFVDERDWARFHTPKNLAMALAGEAGELLELFQWLTPEESAKVMDDPKAAEAVRDELSDILVYVVRLGDTLGVDLAKAVRAKMAKNAAKYPADLARGKATKYTELQVPKSSRARKSRKG